MAGAKKKRKVKASENSKEIELTDQQIRFCENYVSKEFYGNGTQSYIDAYQVDITKKGQYEVAKIGAYENLTKPNLIEYINSMLESQGLNDSFVDKQLLFLIQQHAEFSSKIAAIKEYNKLKQRITEKSEVSINGALPIENWIKNNADPGK